jgi:tetratricopeptide (TPR) repeat protein
MGVRWRSLTAAVPAPADSFLATLELRGGNAKAASDLLQPHLAAAIKQPESYPHVIAVHMRILLGREQVDEAIGIVLPLARKSPVWRGEALSVASMGLKPEVTEKWLRAFQPVVPESEMLTLANAWFTLAVNSRLPQHEQVAAQLLDRLGQSGDQNPMPVMLRAILDAQAGRKTEAEAGYRKVLKLNDKLPEAMNNLALIIADRSQKDLDEAMELARKAVALRPTYATFHDTLGTIQAKKGDLKAAIASLETAVGLEPKEPLWRNNLESLRKKLRDAGATSSALR